MPRMSRGLRVVVGLALSAILLMVLLWLAADALGLADEARLAAWIEEVRSSPSGRHGAGAVIALLLFLDLALPLPSSVLMTLSGSCCGVIAGAAWSGCGALAGAATGFLLCRRFGRAAFRRLIGEGEAPEVERFLADTGAWAVLLSRAVPMLAEVTSCLAGLSRMSFARFFALAAAGTLPVCVAYAWAGDRAGASDARVAIGLPLVIAFAIPAAGYAFVRVLRRRGARAQR